MALTGGCLCGRVRYEVAEPLVSASYCHCTRCQRRTGTGSSAQARTAPGALTIVSGAELVREWAPPDDGLAEVLLLGVRERRLEQKPRRAADLRRATRQLRRRSRDQAVVPAVRRLRRPLGAGARRRASPLRRKADLDRCASTPTRRRRSRGSPGPPSRTSGSSCRPTTGTQLGAFLALPEEPAPTGVVILPDVRGLYRFYEELALRFAERGYAAVAIDYFGRTAGTEPRGDDFEYGPHVEQTTDDGVQSDTGAAAARAAQARFRRALHGRLLLRRPGIVAGGRRGARPRRRGRLLRQPDPGAGRAERRGPRGGDDLSRARAPGRRRREHHGGRQRGVRARLWRRPASSTRSSRTRGRRTASSTASRRSIEPPPTTPGRACSASSTASRDPRDRPGHDRDDLPGGRRGPADRGARLPRAARSTSRGPAGSSTTPRRSGRACSPRPPPRSPTPASPPASLEAVCVTNQRETTPALGPAHGHAGRSRDRLAGPANGGALRAISTAS